MRKANEVIDFIKENKKMGSKKLGESSLVGDIEDIMDRVLAATETTHKDDEDLAKVLDLLVEVSSIFVRKRM